MKPIALAAALATLASTACAESLPDAMLGTWCATPGSVVQGKDGSITVEYPGEGKGRMALRRSEQAMAEAAE